MAGFTLDPVPNTNTTFNLQYMVNTITFYYQWFNAALASFPNKFGRLIFNDIFPGVEIRVSWENYLYPQAVNNPFLGTFQFKQTPTTTRVQCRRAAMSP